MTLPRWLFWLILAVALCATAFGIDRLPLLDPDEGRNAEVAREMATSGEWLVPHYDSLPYLDKPVLYFAAVAGAFRALGAGEAAGRGVSLLFGLGCLALTGALARRRVGADRARWAVLILATSPLFAGFARTIIFDIALTFFVLAAWLAAEEARHGAAWGYPAAWALAALAVLTKGPVALLLFLIGALTLPAGDGAPFRPGRFFHPLSVLPFLALLVPWVWAVERRQPGFLHYALFVETAERLTKSSFKRTGPPWYYLAALWLGLFPWSLPWLANPLARLREVWRTLRTPDPDRGPLLTVIAIVIFFSLSRSKLGGYVLPAFPLLALSISGQAAAPGAGALSRRGSVAALLGLAAICLAPLLLPLPLAAWLKQPPDLTIEIRHLLRNLGGLLGVAAVALLAVSAWKRPGLAPVVLALFLPGLIAVGSGPLHHYAELNSSRRLAQAIRPAGDPTGAPAGVVALHCFPTGLPFYLKESVPLVTETGRELTSTYVARGFESGRLEEARSVLWSRAKLDSAIASGGVKFLVTRKREAPPPGFQPAGDFYKLRLWRLPK